MACPIHTAPKNGRVILVGDDHSTVAKAFWHPYAAPNKHGIDGIWAYATLGGNVEEIDFTPTRWGVTTAEFGRD